MKSYQLKLDLEFPEEKTWISKNVSEEEYIIYKFLVELEMDLCGIKRDIRYWEEQEIDSESREFLAHYNAQKLYIEHIIDYFKERGYEIK